MKAFSISMLFTALLLVSCQHQVDYVIQECDLPGLPDSVSLVAAGDVVGDSKAEIICARDSTLEIWTYGKNQMVPLSDSETQPLSLPLTDQILKMAVGNVDDEDGNELIVVTGQRRYQETKVRVHLVKPGDPWQHQVIFEKFSKRPDPTSLVIGDYNNNGRNEIIVSYFESKYLVETVSLAEQEGAWMADTLEVKRMAMTRDLGQLQGFDGVQMAIGRVYGDEIGMTGDAYLFDQGLMIPAKRGVKVVKIGDADNDGQNEVVLGDGWHQDYGKIARARVAMVEINGEEMNYELIEDVKGQYEISQIEVADINRDGKNEVIAKGNQFTRFYQKDEDGWKVFRDTTFSNRPFAIADVCGDKRLEMIVSGNPVKVYNLGNLGFTSDLDPEIKTEKVYPDSLIGEPAPELSVIRWLNGSFPGLYQSKGKVILLDFWATWCKPCIKTFPELAAYQQKYADQGLQIIGLTKVDRSQSESDIEEFVDTQNFPYPIGISDETLNKLAYGVGGIPHVVLIDKSGKVRFYKVGSQNPGSLEPEIQKLLAED